MIDYRRLRTDLLALGLMGSKRGLRADGLTDRFARGVPVITLTELGSAAYAVAEAPKSPEHCDT